MDWKVKVICAGLLLAAWGLLVAFKMAPAADFVTALRDALISIGVFQATITNPKG